MYLVNSVNPVHFHKSRTEVIRIDSATAAETEASGRSTSLIAGKKRKAATILLSHSSSLEENNSGG